MTRKYPTEFYSYLAVPAGTGRVVEDPETPLEQQIQSLVLSGHYLYRQGRHAAALGSYLQAWGLLPRLVVSTFPELIDQDQAAALLEVDLSEHYLAASAEILRLRDPAAPLVPIVAPVDPPDELVGIAKRFGGRFDTAQHHYQAGRALLEIGETDRAIERIQKAMEADPNNPELQADATGLLGTIAFQRGDFRIAANEIGKALKLYQRLKDSDGITAMKRNLETVRGFQTVPGVAGPIEADGVSADSVDVVSLVHRALPSAATAFAGRPVALNPLLVKDPQGGWAETGSIGGRAAQKADPAPILFFDRAVHVRLDDGGRALEQTTLASRIDADNLQALDTYIWRLPQFVGYLAHVGGFVLPLAIADTYSALGDHQRAETFYLKVRDYRFLNLTIERPMVWRKLARTYLNRAHRLYRDRDMDRARKLYERIVRVTDNGFELTGPLYEGSFSGLRAETLAFLESGNHRAFNDIEYARRIILLEAKINLTQIVNNINYLGFSEDIVPIHTWRYLQNLARYFANQAVQAERSYISFKDKSEQEEFTQLTLEQAVDAQKAALEVEDRRVTAANAQHDVAQLNADLNQIRLDNASEQKNEYAAVSAELAKLEEINGWATGPMDKAEIGEAWADELGIAPGTYDTYQITRIVARHRSELNRDYELSNMDRRIEEQQAALAIAQGQVEVADKMVAVAEAQYELAELRADQAAAQLEHFNAQEFTPELWNNLAEAQRLLSQRYLDWAIGAAFLMERAFEFEHDTEVNRIRFDYERSELHGLLAADFLTADIDQFSYDRILETEKLVPSKVSIALADRYPFQFQRQFKQTGRLDFETFLDDFDRWQPGAHLRKLKRIEVVIEGLVGPEGIHGTLTNSGVSYYRGRDGRRNQRLQKPETLILSRYDLRHDGFVFTVDEDLLEVFENSGVASGWILDIPPGSNDLDYDDITNIHVVFYYDAYYSQAVSNMARAELAAGAIHEHTLGLGLRFQYPDAFFGFQDSGEVAFTVDSAYLPAYHTEPRILNAYLVVQTDDDVSAANLEVQVVSAGGSDVTGPTDANGMISSGGGAPLEVLRDEPLMGEWTVRIPEAANAAAFAAGFSWEAVRNIFLYVEYRYIPRGWGKPFADDFAADPMAAFEVVDDPQAVASAPSSWSYDAAGQRIRQTSNIHAPSGNANLNDSPEKPGTYLLRRVSEATPGVDDFVLQTRVSSGDNDGLGVVFRYQDSDNFYFFTMDAQRGFRLLGKKVGGTFQLWDLSAVDSNQGYNLQQEYALTVSMVGDACSVALDGLVILSGRDGDLGQPGRVGFYSWGNSNARFHDFRLQSLKA